MKFMERNSRSSIDQVFNIETVGLDYPYYVPNSKRIPGERYSSFSELKKARPDLFEGDERYGDFNMKFRKKPVIIEAIQYTGDNIGEVLEFISAHTPDGIKRKWWSGASVDGALCIETLEGTMWASFDDWIIIGVAGEVYPCKPDIFEATYAMVEYEE